MGVKKDLERAKAQLTVAKDHLEETEVAAAKKVLEGILKSLDTIVKAHTEKKKKAEDGLKKLKAAVDVVDDVLDRTPFDGRRALDAIKKATDAADVAATTAAAATS